MKKCIIFSRVSTFRQDLVQQTNELIREANNLGYKDSDIIRIEQKESAIKLSIEERKGIQMLYQNIESDSDIDCIIVYEISRLSRQSAMLFELRDYLINHSIQLVCLKPYMRLLEDGKMSQTASILFSLFSSISESEMMIKKERLMRGRHAKKEQSKYIGGGILFGYKKDENDNIIIDEEDAETVRKIFLKYSQGHSICSISREMKERGRLNRFTDNLYGLNATIRTILRREDYTGKRGTAYHYPQIISKELFDKVQPLITRSKEKNKSKNQYLLKSLLWDKEHNARMQGRSSSNVYSNWTGVHSLKLTRTLNLNVKVMDEFVCGLVHKYIDKHIDSFRQDEQLRVQHDMRVCDEMIFFANEKINQIEKNIDKVQVRIIEGKIDEAKGDMMIDNYKIEIEQQHNLIDKMNAKLESMSNEVSTSIYDVDFDNLSTTEKNGIIKQIIDKIEVSFMENGNFKNYLGIEKKTLRRRKLEVAYKDGNMEEYIFYHIAGKSWVE